MSSARQSRFLVASRSSTVSPLAARCSRAAWQYGQPGFTYMTTLIPWWRVTRAPGGTSAGSGRGVRSVLVASQRLRVRVLTNTSGLRALDVWDPARFADTNHAPEPLEAPVYIAHETHVVPF